MEKQVRQQMAARLEGHEQRNEDRKLTAEERAKKAVNKWRVRLAGTCRAEGLYRRAKGSFGF